MISRIALAFGLASTLLCAADSKKYPSWPTIAVPSPMPPKVDPAPASTLAADQVYVVQSDVPCVLIASPEGIVSITEEAGPIRIRGKFVDGPDQATSRTYDGKQVFVVEALAKGQVELIKIPKTLADTKAIERRTLSVMGLAPQPPPGPGPGPGPQPPSPAPIPDAGFRVLVVYEAMDAARLPAAQNAILTSGIIRDYLDAKCVVGPDGKTKEYRIWDKDTNGNLDSKLWGDAMARPRKSIPWILISDGKTGFEGPLPADVTSTLDLLKKYGG